MRLMKVYARAELRFVPRFVGWLSAVCFVAAVLLFFKLLYFRDVESSAIYIFVALFGRFGFHLFIRTSSLIYENYMRRRAGDLSEFPSASKNGTFPSPDYNAAQSTNFGNLIIPTICLGIMVRFLWQVSPLGAD